MKIRRFLSCRLITSVVLLLAFSAAGVAAPTESSPVEFDRAAFEAELESITSRVREGLMLVTARYHVHCASPVNRHLDGQMGRSAE